MTAVLPLAIGLVALLYASVGHAGATGYIAVMTLAGLDPKVIRPTALVLNVIVATIATVQFARAGHFRRGLFMPLAAASVPCALAGGSATLPLAAFEAVLGGVLLASACGVVLDPRSRGGEAREEPAGARLGAGAGLGFGWLLPLGAVIGLLSGLTGVGGGVFLTPALLAARAAPVKTVAAVTAPFILVNSLAGLCGGIVAGRTLPAISLPVVAAVVAGGLAGSQLGAFRLPARWLRLLMAVVLTVAGVKLLLAVLH